MNNKLNVCTFVTIHNVTYYLDSITDSKAVLVSKSGKVTVGIAIEDLEVWEPVQSELVISYNHSANEISEKIKLIEFDKNSGGTITSNKVLYPYGFPIYRYREAYQASLEQGSSSAITDEKITVQIAVLDYTKANVVFYSLEVNKDEDTTEAIELFLFDELDYNTSDVDWLTYSKNIKIIDNRL